ncbi:MAG: SDR family NAD(P)-dependent oxidoreductase [Flavobacteriales bacterium]
MNVVVTGASSGIGYDVVKEFVRNNASHIYVISRSKEKLNRLKEECKSLGSSEITVLAMDLNRLDTSELKSVIGEKTIDILINNAGSLVNAPFMEINAKQLQDVYSTNVFAPFLVIQTLLSNIVSSEIAHIVNIGSIGGVQGSSKFPGLSAYSSSKAAIAGLTECLAEELKEEGVKVNCLALGAVNTEMLAAAFPGYVANINPSEMAKYIVHFALNDYKYINGKIVSVSSSTP